MIDLPPELTLADKHFPRAYYNRLRKALAYVLQRMAGGEGVAGMPDVSCTTQRIVPGHDVVVGDVLVPEGRVYVHDGAVWTSLDAKGRRPEPHDVNVVVMLDPTKAGTTGRAATGGTVWCNATIEDTAHRYLAIGDDGRAVSADAGWALIIDPAPEGPTHPGVGDHPVQIRFPVGGGGPASPDELAYAEYEGSAGKVYLERIALLAEPVKNTNWRVYGDKFPAVYLMGDTPASS